MFCLIDLLFHPGFQNEPRQMFKNFVFKTAQTSSIADRLIFSARFSLIKHARHWFLGFYHVARHELLVLKSINISEYQSEAFSWNVLVFLWTVNFSLFLKLNVKVIEQILSFHSYDNFSFRLIKKVKNEKFIYS